MIARAMVEARIHRWRAQGVDVAYLPEDDQSDYFAFWMIDNGMVFKDG